MISKKRGFTLIELLVVVSIVSLLSAIVMTSLSSARAKGRDARRMRDIEEIRTAIELYIADNGTVPDLFAVDKDSSWDTLATYLVPKYLKKLSTDPCGTTMANCQSAGGTLAYEYEGPTKLINADAGTVFGITITSTTYSIYAENLEKKPGVFGFGVVSF